MYCEHCGYELPDEAKFCPNCGNKIGGNASETSSGIDPNEVFDKSADLVKRGAADFKEEWSTWSNKRKILSLIVCCCIGWIVISSVMGALTPDKNSELFDQTNEGKDISLIKESTSGYAFYSSNKTVYQYDLKGVFKNIPADPDGFTVRGIFYDDGKVIKEDEMDLDYYSYYTENSEPTSLVSIQTHDFENVTDVQVIIMNPDGEVVFDETYDYDMDKFDLSGLDEKPEIDSNEDTDSTSDSSSSSDDDSSSSSSSSYSSSSSSSSSSGVTYVGSVNSDKFHYPSCSHAKRIKDSNKITFSSRDNAIAAGYSPCGVCKP